MTSRIDAERDLLARVAHGNQEAFAALYDALAAETWTLCRRRFGDSAAEQGMQALWLAIWTQAPTMLLQHGRVRALIRRAALAA